MNAPLELMPHYRSMTAADIDTVLIIENSIYLHPWTRGNFSDSLSSGYRCLIMEIGNAIVGYAIIMMGVDEAHLLNLSVASLWQRRGLGRHLLQQVITLMGGEAALRLLLEVRESNTAAQRLYHDSGFFRISQRSDYYPALRGREDAIVMERTLR